MSTSTGRDGRDGWVAETRPLNRRAYIAAVVSFGIAVAGGVIAAWGYWTDNAETILGLGLSAALLGIGIGLASWAKFLDLDEHAVQQRERLRTTPEERRDVHAALTLHAPATESRPPSADATTATSTTADATTATDATTVGEPTADGPDGEDGAWAGRGSIGRRRLLVGLLAGSLGSLVIGFVGPIGSLGPKPRGERARTAWYPGARLVTVDGTPIPVETNEYDQLVTVFPDSGIGDDDAQVVLLRVQPEQLSDRTADGSVEGWVAYSKICTHAGCSVGLFGIDTRPPDVLRQLVCPCHQSVFDPIDAAEPVGGPAPRSLPQLPLAVDDQGFLVARAAFDRPVGPIAWNEG